MYMYIFHYLNYYLPDFVTTICLGAIFGFSFLDICFTLPWCHSKALVESSFLTRDQAPSLRSGSTDSKTIDYQRTNPRKYQIVTTHTKETTWIWDLASPDQQYKMPHLNNKQNKNANPIISRQYYHLTQPCPTEEKWTNKQKLSTNRTLYKVYTNHWTNLRKAETKRKKEFNLETCKKRDNSNTIS